MISAESTDENPAWVHPPTDPRPLATFRLYPDEERTLYVRANVWRTKKQMHDRARTYGLEGLRDTDGCCSDIHVVRLHAGIWRRDPIVAEVNFWRRRLSTEVVTHELLHATLAYARRCRLDFVPVATEASGAAPAEEEFLCYAHGTLVRQFVDRAERARL